MRHATTILGGIGALIASLVFVIAVPAGLVSYVGWPLPATLPSIDQYQIGEGAARLEHTTVPPHDHFVHGGVVVRRPGFHFETPILRFLRFATVEEHAGGHGALFARLSSQSADAAMYMHTFQCHPLKT